MNHHHTHSESAELSTEEKLAKLLDHWKKHNDEHANTYELWAKRAVLAGLESIGAELDKAAQKTRAINENFQNALKQIKPA
ncbi:MAG: hypothetical protein JRH15_10345 [Deltaproteobacteria bacterium]|nr:hypothetical protein [Deltaproteobacteria bacterium]